MIEHNASYGSRPYNVVKNLENVLDSKKAVLLGQQNESIRLEKAIIETAAQIKEITAAINILKKSLEEIK